MAINKHKHTDECWEPDSGCDMGKNPEFVAVGNPFKSEADELQLRWRNEVVDYNEKDAYNAVIAALAQGGIQAWYGDGTGCVVQMLANVYRQRDRAYDDIKRLQEREQWFVEQAAKRAPLEGYRELGDRAAAAENMRDEIQAKVNSALKIAFEYGAYDGGHHKMWTIDQMVRALTGSDYSNWVAEFKNGEDGPETYEWDEGIAP